MEKIDAVKMVREIRDAQYDETKDMSREEYLRYIKENGSKALERLKEMAHLKHVA